MLIEKAVYKKVQVYRNELIKDEVHGCDHCSEIINNYPNEHPRLNITEFYDNYRDTENLHFCSWECVLAGLFKSKADNFLTFPSIYAGKGNKELGGLLKLLKDKGLDKANNDKNSKPYNDTGNWFERIPLHWKLLYHWIGGIAFGVILAYIWIIIQNQT